MSLKFWIGTRHKKMISGRGLKLQSSSLLFSYFPNWTFPRIHTHGHAHTVTRPCNNAFCTTWKGVQQLINKINSSENPISAYLFFKTDLYIVALHWNTLVLKWLHSDWWVDNLSSCKWWTLRLRWGVLTILIVISFSQTPTFAESRNYAPTLTELQWI